MITCPAPFLRLSVVAFALTLAARGDTLRTPNGEILHGTVMRETAEFVVFQSASFGEIRVPRTPGMEVGRAAPAAQTAAASHPPAAPSKAAAPAVSGSPGKDPASESWIRTALGLSSRWSAELEANLLLQNDVNRMSARATELTIGYKVPNETKPAQPLHDYGLFGSYSFQKVNQQVVGKNTEISFRYFYQPPSPWLLASQADWTRDQINGIDSRAHVLVVPARRLIDTTATRLFAGVGPALLSDSLIFFRSPAGQFEHREAGFRVAAYQLLQHRFSPGLTFRQTLVLLSRPDEPQANYNLRFAASLRRMLTPHLSLSLSYDYVRNESGYVPPPGSEGPLGKIGTTKLMLGYGL